MAPIEEEFSSPRIWRESTRYLPAVLGPMVTGMVTVLILPRLLGPTGLGEFVLAVGTVASVTVFLGEWLIPTTIRFFPEFDSRSRLAEFRYLLMVLAAMAVSVGAILVATLLSAFGVTEFLLPGILMVVSGMVVKVFMAEIRASLANRRYGVVVAAGSITSTAVGLALLLVTQRASAFLWGSVIANLLVAGWFLAWGHDHPYRLRRTSLGPLRGLLAFGLPVIVTALASQILGIGDRYLLAAFSGLGEVGVYAANYNVADKAIGLIFAPIFGAMYPFAARAWAREDHSAAIQSLDSVARAFVVLGGLAVTVAVLVGGNLFPFVLGSGFAAGGAVVGLIAMGAFLWHFGSIGHQPLELAKRTMLITLLVVVTAALNFGLNLVLIPRIGISGAAYATLISYGVYAALSFFVGRQVTKVKVAVPWDAVARVVGFGLMAWPLAWIFVRSGQGALVAAFVAVPAYALWLWLTREPLLRDVLRVSRTQVPAS